MEVQTNHKTNNSEMPFLIWGVLVPRASSEVHLHCCKQCNNYQIIWDSFSYESSSSL